MRHQLKKLHLNRDRDHRQALLRNLATSIILYEKVKTTKAKAKAVQPVVEKLITTAKQDNLIKAIRKLEAIVFDENASRKAVEKLKKRYSNRQSGYTRIIPLGRRNGDSATLVQIELV